MDDPAHHGSRRGIGVVLLPPADPDLRERNASSRAPEHSSGRRCAGAGQPGNRTSARRLGRRGVPRAGGAGIGATLGALLESLDVSVETNTEILSIRASDPDPVRAQRLAQGFAQAYTTFRREHAQEQFRAQADEIRDQITGVEDDIAVIEAEISQTEDPEEQNDLSAERDS